MCLNNINWNIFKTFTLDRPHEVIIKGIENSNTIFSKPFILIVKMHFSIYDLLTNTRNIQLKLNLENKLLDI